jgi:mRNA interferase RelE/StbE
MTTYKVELLDKKVRRQLDRIREPDFSRIADAILALERTPRPPGCRKLRTVGGWRIRVGRWRVIYHIDDKKRLVTIVEVRRRREDTYR